MKKHLFMVMAVLLVVAVAAPSFALEVKYGGLFRMRWFSNNNILDGADDSSINLTNGDDHQNYFDERIRMFFTFVSSENLKGVIAFEQDVLWGDSRSKVLDGHRDAVGLELKHAYLDFAIPNTTVRAVVGLQPINLISGWIIDEDFTAIMLNGKFDPIRVSLGYVAERNGANGFDVATVSSGVNTERENVDDFAAVVSYAQGPISANLVGFYQMGHDARDAGLAPNNAPPIPVFPVRDNRFGVSNPFLFNPWTPVGPFGNDDNLFDLGLNFSYKQEFWNFTFNFVKNFGSFERALAVVPGIDNPALVQDVDYTGFMLEGIGNYFCGPWTFTLGALYTSGDDDFTDDELSAFVYPLGADHHWAEILGGGSLDTAINDFAGVGAGDNFGQNSRGNYSSFRSSAFGPSNLWSINAGVAYQVMEGTKLTFNYYFAATAEDVLSGTRVVAPFLEFDNTIGHELDLYIDQRIVDKLMLRLVGAYLFAGDAFTALNDDDDAYEVGAVLSWSF